METGASQQARHIVLIDAAENRSRFVRNRTENSGDDICLQRYSFCGRGIEMMGRIFDIRFLDESGHTIIILVTVQETSEAAIERARFFADFQFNKMQIWCGLRVLTDLSSERVAA